MNRAVCCLIAIFAFSAVTFAQNEAPKEINGGVLNGKAISLPKPEYSEEAKASKMEGIVRLNVLVAEDGSVMTAEPVTGPFEVFQPGGDGKPKQAEPEPVSPLLVEAAQRAALAAKFSPTMLSGVPIKVRGTLIYRFFQYEASNPAPSMSGINGGVLNGKAISLPKPDYPAAARAVRAAGAVTVRVTIGENGAVESASAASGHPLLRDAAIEAARSAKFSQTLLSGNPVKVSGVIVYNFIAPDEVDK